MKDIFYTIQPVSTVADLRHKRFLYNNTKYNLYILNNSVNKLYGEVLTQNNFIKKKGTIPICGFILNDKYKKINTRMINRSICEMGRSNAVTLIIYEVDDLDKLNHIIYDKTPLSVLMEKCMHLEKSYDNIIDIDDYNISKKFKKLLKTYKYNKLFGRGVKHDHTVLLPRLRTINMIGMINPYYIIDIIDNNMVNDKSFFNHITNHKEFIQNNRGIYRKINK